MILNKDMVVFSTIRDKRERERGGGGGKREREGGREIIDMQQNLGR